MLVRAEEENTASIMVEKQTEVDGVVNQEFKVKIVVHNYGKAAAYNLDIKDEVPNAEPKEYTLEQIEPGSNKTFEYSFVPTEIGSLYLSAAKVTYKLKADDKESKIMKSTFFPVISILDAADYEKKHDKHYDEWGIFVALSMVPVGLPYFAYVYSQSKIKSLTSDVKNY
eukprot:gene6299-10305_t